MFVLAYDMPNDLCIYNVLCCVIYSAVSEWEH